MRFVYALKKAGLYVLEIGKNLYFSYIKRL